MTGCLATSRPLPALVVTLAIVACGCAITPSPTPPGDGPAATVTPVAESATTASPGSVAEAGSPSPSDPAWTMPYEQYDRPFRAFPDIETTAQLVVDISGLRDMTGLDLVAGLD
jgi:hypothetical protein